MGTEQRKTAPVRNNRPHHRTTIITTTRRSYNAVRKLREGEQAEVEFVNDIISSAKGGQSKVHHSIRRVALLRRQVAGGYSRIRVRWEQGVEIPCTIVGKVVGDIDGLTAKVRIAR